MSLAEQVEAALIGFKFRRALLLDVVVISHFLDDYLKTERAVWRQIIFEADGHAGELGAVSQKRVDDGLAEELLVKSIEEEAVMLPLAGRGCLSSFDASAGEVFSIQRYRVGYDCYKLHMGTDLEVGTECCKGFDVDAPILLGY